MLEDECKTQYKSQYKSDNTFCDLRKTSRYNSNSSIVDILSEDVYFGLKDTKDNIAKTASKLYDNSIGVLVNDKVKRGKFVTVSATLLGGLTVAGLFNHFGADAAYAKDYVAEKISNHSFKLELYAHAGFSLLAFMTMSTVNYMKKQGYSFWKSFKLSTVDLAVLTSVSAPIAFLGYEPLREKLVIEGITEGVEPKWAVLWAQLKLVAPYYISVVASHKLLRYFVTDRLGITNGNGKNSSKDKLLLEEIPTATIGPEKNNTTNTIEDKVNVAS